MEDNTTKLEEAQVEDIAETLEEIVDSSEDLKVLRDLPSNNGVEEVETPSEGYSADVMVTIDPNTGEAKNAVPVEDNDEDDTITDDFDDLIKDMEERNDPDEPVEITEDDIKEQIDANDDIFNGFEVTRDEIVQIMQVADRYQRKEKFNVFKALPESVQNRINEYVGNAGLAAQTYAPEVNSVRNDIAEMIINEFVSNISMNKFTANFQKEMATLQNKINEEFSKMYLDYDKNRNKYIEEIMEKETDETKKEAIGKILDAINDGFKLERIKEAARNHRIKIKKYDLERPDKVYRIIHDKYNTGTQNIYSVQTASNVLWRHLKNDVESQDDITRFLVAICKYCLNYNNEVPEEHAFMYYAMYNAILLDVYKGEEYDEFYNSYKPNVLEVIDLLKNKK